MKFIRDIINEKTRAAGRADNADLHYPLLLREDERADERVDESEPSQVEVDEAQLDVPHAEADELSPFAKQDQEAVDPWQAFSTAEIEPAKDVEESETFETPEELEDFNLQFVRDGFVSEEEAIDHETQSVLGEADDEVEVEAPSLVDHQDDTDLEEVGFDLEVSISPAVDSEVEHSFEDAQLDSPLENAQAVSFVEAQTFGDDAPEETIKPHAALDETSPEFIADPEPVMQWQDEEPEMSSPDIRAQDPEPSEPFRAEAEMPELPSAVSVHKPTSGRSSSRGRVKTRLLGFSAPQSASQDPLDRKTAASASGYAKYPVGWLAVVDGPGTGATFPLFDGLTQIGRGEGQGVCLDFGDNSISRENHAAIAYDDEQRRFYFGQGGKANLVRLNGRPTLSTEEMDTNSIIRIGETTLRFVALCGEDFSWRGEEKDDMQHAKLG